MAYSTMVIFLMAATAVLMILVGLSECHESGPDTTHRDPHAHSYSSSCQSLEEETFFLGRPLALIQDKIAVINGGHNRNATVTHLEGWNNDTTSRRYTCPWRYQLVTDPDRYPSVSVEARCLYKRCEALPRTHDETRPSTKRHAPVYSRCQEVYYYRWLMVKQVTGRWAWKLYPVPVACTCARNQVVAGRMGRRGGKGPADKENVKGVVSGKSQATVITKTGHLKRSQARRS